MALEKEKVRQLLKEVRTSTGRDSSRKASALLDYVRSATTGDYVKRNEDPKTSHDGRFMAVKKDGKPFQGVPKEPDKRRRK